MSHMLGLLQFRLPPLPPDAPTPAELDAIDAVNATPVDERVLRRAWREAERGMRYLDLALALKRAGIGRESLTNDEIESAFVSELWACLSGHGPGECSKCARVL